MSYKKLKERLIESKIKFEQLDECYLKDLNIKKDTINRNLIQYFIFFEELEQKIKLNPSVKIQSYGRQIHLIVEYLDVLDKTILKKNIN